MQRPFACLTSLFCSVPLTLWILALYLQDNKSDVKAIMARFQAGGTSMEVGAGGRPKVAVHPTLSGPTVPSKKPVLETSLSGSAAANSSTPKPSYLKNTVSTKSAPEARESLKPKALVSRFENTNTNTNEDSKPPFAKPLKPKLPDSSQDTEQKPQFPKAPLHKPTASSTAPDSKSPFPKPPPVTSKPSWTLKAENNGSSPNTSVTPKMPVSKPKPSAISSLLQQTDETKDADPLKKPFTSAKQSSFRAAQSVFNKSEEAAKDEAKSTSSKESPASNPTIAPKPSYCRKPSGSSIQSVNDDPSAPKKKPLPNILALGSPPSKPNRPPRVNLEKFKKAAESSNEGERRVFNSLLHMLRMSAMEAKEQDKKREKEEKKRVEQGKKDQKERERKEQEARKKFKLTGPLQVIHKVKARVDCKGGKNDLSIKQGEPIDILRITENPEGRWLARTQDGSYGYVKTESVEIDFDKLRNQGLSLPSHMDQDDGEVYDDVHIYSCIVVAGLNFFPSLPKLKAKAEAKTDDPKKQKKFEKEEKEFRKKFKFEGEIQVLYQVTAALSKKGSGKELAVQGGEVLDVIHKPEHDKLICRNKEGKCEDIDIYDDIGDGRSSKYLCFCRYSELDITC
uniref:SH3 domain-containing protein n=1 Tax=Pygocentrus nattereri TaxID=42514 RepID=A0AAR2JRD6_PYGNA